jgi:hypothetical protein
MSVIAIVEFVPSHMRKSQRVRFSRLPCVGESVYDDDGSAAMQVVSVFHPLIPSTKNPPMIRVKFPL